MNEDLRREIEEMNMMITDFSRKFKKFQEKRVITGDMSIKLHTLVMSIEDYINADLKLYNDTVQDMETRSETDTMSRGSINQVSSDTETSKARKRRRKNKTTSQKQSNDVEVKSESSVIHETHNPQQRTIEKDTEQYLNDILKTHGILTKSKTFVICGLCQVYLPQYETEINAHLEDKHSVFCQDRIEKYIKVAVYWTFSCNLCEIDNISNEKVTEHIESNSHLAIFSTKPERITDSLARKHADSKYVVVKLNRTATCKLCKKCWTSNDTELILHLTTFHKIPFNDVKDFYEWTHNTFYHCEICQRDVSKRTRIVDHLFLDKEHVKKFLRLYKKDIILPEYITLFPFTEINNVNTEKFSDFVLNKIHELRNNSPDDAQLLEKHRITRDLNDHYICGLCTIEIELPTNVIKHLMNVYHLFCFYKITSRQFIAAEDFKFGQLVLNAICEIQRDSPENIQLLMKHRIIIRPQINSMFFCDLCKNEIGLSKKIMKHLLSGKHLFNYLESFSRSIDPEFREFVINQILEIQFSIPEDPILLAKHHVVIQHNQNNVFFCELCKRDIGLLVKVVKHLLDMKHLKKFFDIYNSGRLSIAANNLNIVNGCESM